VTGGDVGLIMFDGLIPVFTLSLELAMAGGIFIDATPLTLADE
jgi:hypothetical protein